MFDGIPDKTLVKYAASHFISEPEKNQEDFINNKL